jgi:hypothetical protein
VGPVNSDRRDLNIGTFTVTRITKRTGQYAILGVCQHVTKDDTRVMTEDEVVLNTTLNLAMRPLSGTRREFSEKHIKLNSTYDGGFFSHPFSP